MIRARFGKLGSQESIVTPVMPGLWSSSVPKDRPVVIWTEDLRSTAGITAGKINRTSCPGMVPMRGKGGTGTAEADVNIMTSPQTHLPRQLKHLLSKASKPMRTALLLCTQIVDRIQIVQ